MSDLSELQKFLDDSYRVSYLDSHVKGSIAYQIQALREKEKLTQREFGNVVDMPQTVISRLEDTEYGSVNINTLLKIANKLKIGLEVRFCNFESVLAADVSPVAFQVENIKDTVSRLTTAQTKNATSRVTTTNVVATVMVVNQSTTPGGHSWPTKPTSNPWQTLVFPGSGTNNIAKSTPTAPSPE